MLRWLRGPPGGDALPQPLVPPEEAGRLMRLATSASVAVAALLIFVKLVAWLFTDSVSVLSSLADSLMDVMASAVNFFAVRHALMPPDREHRFGHGKAEPLAGLAQSAFIAGSAVFLTIEAIRRLFHPQPVAYADIGISVMIFSIIVTVALVTFQRYVVHQTGSTAVSGDALHYQTDVFINASVIVSLGLSQWFGWHVADPIFGFAIAVFLARGAWQIARRSLDILMDHEFSDAAREQIKEIVLGHPEARGVHDLRTRSAGIQPFIQLHLELDGDLRLIRAHEIADEVEALIMEAFPSAEVIIHQDPEGLIERRPDYAR